MNPASESPAARRPLTYMSSGGARSGSDRGGLARLALSALALILPFELRTPWLSIGGAFVMTDVELVAAAVLLLWGLSLIVERRLPRIGVTGAWAVVALAGAMLLSAALAPTDKEAALKFSLRSMTGMAVFFAAVDLLRTQSQRRPVLIALTAGAAISATLGLLEGLGVPAVSGILSAFRTGPSRIGGFLRTSGTFEYANIAAMFWEAVLPLALVTVASSQGSWVRKPAPDHRPLITALCLLALGILGEALILTFSRAAWIGAATALAAVTLAAWRRGDRSLVRYALAVGGVIALLGVGTYAATPVMAARIRSENDSAWYRVTYASPASITLVAGELSQITVTVRNESVITWPAAGPQRVALSYHLFAPDTRNVIQFEGARTYLTDDLPPGQAVTLGAWIFAPRAPGRYSLMWDMVQENTIWFSQKAGDAALIPLEVTAAGATGQPARQPASGQRLTGFTQPSRLMLWSIAWQLFREQPLLGIGPDNFRHRYGPYTGSDKWDDRIHTNNMFIEAFVNLGVIGGTIFLIVIGMGLIWPLRAVGSGPGAGGSNTILAIGLLGAIVAFATHGLVDYFLEFTPTYLLFWLVLGLSAGLWHHRGEEARNRLV